MPSELKQKYEKLASIKDSRSRSFLVRSITAEYTNRKKDSAGDIEVRLFSSIVLDLFDNLDLEVRRDIIILLAKTKLITRTLAERLALETIPEVASLFEHSPLLTDDFLLQAIRKRESPVRLAIAKRPKLTMQMVDALIAAGDIVIKRKILRNPGAEFSKNAILVCLIDCRNFGELNSEIAARCLFDQTFYDKLKKLVDAGCPFLTPSFSQAIYTGEFAEYIRLHEVEEDHDLEIDGRILSREEVSVQLNMGELSFNSVLLILIERKSKDGIIWFLNSDLNISTSAMEHILLAGNTTSLARMLSCQKVSAATFHALLKLRHGWMPYSVRNYFEEIESYKKMLKTQISLV